MHVRSQWLLSREIVSNCLFWSTPVNSIIAECRIYKIRHNADFEVIVITLGLCKSRTIFSANKVSLI